MQTLKRLKEILSDVHARMDDLSGHLNRIRGYIDKGHLIPDEILEQASQSLLYCRSGETSLREAAAELHIPVDISLDEIQKSAKKIEEEENFRNKVRNLVYDYFRLTTTADTTIQALEESKRKLMKVCALLNEESQRSLVPYQIVVERTISGEDIDDDEFDLIEKDIGKPIARALDKGILSLRTDADIMPYLDDSCDLLHTEKKSPIVDLQIEESNASEAIQAEKTEANIKKQELQVNEENRQQEESKPVSVVKEEMQAEADIEKEASTDPDLWKEYTGYVDDGVSFRVENDTLSEKISSKEFVNAAKKHRWELLFCTHIIACMRLLPQNKTPEFYEDHALPSLEDQDYLKRHKLCAECVVSVDGKESTYLVLSSKAYASLKKDDVRRHIRSIQKSDLLLPNNFLKPISQMSVPFVYCCTLLIDYIAKMQIKTGFTISSGEKNEEFVYSCIVPKNCADRYMIVPAFFTKGKETQSIHIVMDYLLTDKEKLPVVLLVNCVEDIGIICRNMSVEHPEIVGRLRFADIHQPNVMLNNQLRRVNLDGSNYSEKPEEATERLESVEEVQHSEASAHSDVFESCEEETQLPENRKVEEPEPKKADEQSEKVELKNVLELPKQEQTEGRMKQPEEEKAYVKIENVDEKLAIPHLENARRAFSMGRSDVGNIILCGISKYIEQYSKLTRRYAYASGDPMLTEDYRVSNLQKYFDEKCGSDLEYDLLEVATWLRMYFSDAASFESYLSSDTSYLQDNLAYKYVPELKELIFELACWVKKQKRGVDNILLSIALKQNTYNDVLVQLQRDAHALLVNNVLRQSSHRTQRIKRMRGTLFKADGFIISALRAVCENDKKQIHSIEASVKAYVNLEKGVPDICPKAIDALMDDAWNKNSNFAKGKGRSNSLTGSERSTLSNQLTNVFGIIGRWILVSGETNNVSSEQNSAVITLIQKIAPFLEAAQQKLGELKSRQIKEAGAIVVLQKTLTELTRRLTGEDSLRDTRHEFYIQLLKEPFVALDADCMPYVEEPYEQIMPFDFCERAAGYLSAPERKWDEVIHRIFDVDATRQFGDYGCAEALKCWLNENEKEWLDEYDIQRYIERAQDKTNKRADSVYLWEQNFTARLEMADGDGWFTTTADRKHIEQVRIAQREAYLRQNNFGFYGRSLLHLIEYAHQKATKLRPQYLQRLNKIKEFLPEEEQKAEILERIEGLIQEDRFGAAESYLQQAERGTLEMDYHGLSDSNSFFKRFIASCDNLCRYSKLDQILITRYRQLYGNEKRSILKSGEELIQAWPASGMMSRNGNSTESIRRLLGGLNLNANVTGSNPHYHAQLADPGRIENYPHPIAQFGSVMYKRGLNIELIFKNKDSDELFTAINELLQKTTDNTPVLILANCAITLPERRKLARKFAQNLRTTPCLILDRVLVMYLAGLPLSERWKILIQCALPFQPVEKQNPFFENSSAEIPPDMFIGRRDELHSIINPGGANLIYGGRQLGKTALLQRAKTLQHRPLDRSWSAYVDVKNMSSEEAASQIATTLTQQDFFKQKPKVECWRDLTQCIEERLMDKVCRDDQLLLLIDEADALLIDCEKHDYKELDQFKRLQNTADGRFKFVMAGLHNVLRFSKKSLANNSGVPQLQGITVKPLSFSDARELLELPLSYLGFTIPEGQEDIIAQILFNTNYFPGLVHFYASRLVRHMQRTANEAQMPPYELDRDVLTRVLADEEFRTMRIERLKMTLGIDAQEHSYYDILAHLLCFCCNDSEDVMLYGMTASEIYCELGSFASPMIAALDVKQIEVLLNELVDLNILRKEQNGNELRYLFSRPSFIEMLGTKREVEDHLLKILDPANMASAETH